jgi:hypothetical protein
MPFYASFAEAYDLMKEKKAAWMKQNNPFRLDRKEIVSQEV